MQPTTHTQPTFRLSKQRRVILEQLRSVTSHPTADDIYDMVRQVLPRISLGTVYRNLEFLCSQGLALKLGAPGEQKRFDGNSDPHPHIRCLGCGKVEDLHTGPDLPDLDEAQAMGYTVTGCNLEYVGYCPDCTASC